ncbi:MAG: hypothetical protein MRY83_22890 [Flavobacteriales bacterium]|nr:hypothetical protein [Flavobacteriales bacterium]
MGLLNNLFSSKHQPEVTNPDFGPVKLIFSKRDKHIWSGRHKDVIFSVRGTNREPDEKHLKIIKNINYHLNILGPKINRKFVKEFSAADLEIDMENWPDRFELRSVEIMMIFENEIYWNITFQDKKDPFAHFTLFVEGDRLTDFAIDT